MGIGAAVGAAVAKTFFAGNAIAALVTSIAVNSAISLAANALASSKLSGGRRSGERDGRTQNIRSNTFPHQVVYGECRKGGLIFYINGTGNNNDYLHIMLALAAHECEDVSTFYFNGELTPLNGSGLGAPAQPTGALSNNVNLEWKPGTDTQTAIAAAVADNSNWTNDHRAKGRCYAWIELKDNATLFPNFIPAITARMKGMNSVWDPRDDSYSWTDNPALIVADILVRYLGVPQSRIDVAHLTQAANVCDELVAKKDLTTEKRYRAGGFFDLEGDPGSWLEPFIGAMAGNVTEHAGVYYINAGEWQESVLTITEDNVLSGIRYRTADSDFSRSNAVKGVFVGPDTYDQPTDFPAIKNAVAIAEDGGVLNWLELDLEMVPTHTQAQRVANIHLESAREDETLELSVDILTGLDIKPWDTVTVDLPTIGIDGTWQVVTHTINPGDESEPAMSVALQLKRHTEDVYDWNPATDEKDMDLGATSIPGSGGSKPQFVEYSVTLNNSDPVHNPADIDLTWTDPEGTIVELEVEVTLDYEYRITDTDAGTGGNQPGPWIPATIVKTTTVAEGVGNVSIAMDNLALSDPSGFDFQEWDFSLVRVRSKIDATTWSDWVNATPA